MDVQVIQGVQLGVLGWQGACHIWYSASLQLSTTLEVCDRENHMPSPANSCWQTVGKLLLVKASAFQSVTQALDLNMHYSTPKLSKHQLSSRAFKPDLSSADDSSKALSPPNTTFCSSAKDAAKGFGETGQTPAISIM